MRALSPLSEICAEMKEAEEAVTCITEIAALCSLEGFETFYVLFLGAVFSGNVRDVSLFSHRRISLDEMRHWGPIGYCLKQLVGAI